MTAKVVIAIVATFLAGGAVGSAATQVFRVQATVTCQSAPTPPAADNSLHKTSPLTMHTKESFP